METKGILKKLKIIIFIFCSVISFEVLAKVSKVTITTNKEVITKIPDEENSFELRWSQEDIGEDVQVYFDYLKAAYQHCSGKPLQALQTYEKLQQKNLSPYAHEVLIRLLFDINQFEKIINLQSKILNAFDDNLDVQLVLAQSYLNLNKDDKAEKIFEKLVKIYPDNEQVAYYTAVSYIKGNQFDKALEFIENCIKKPALRSKSFLFYFLASKIYFNQGRSVKALEYSKKSVELYPNFEKGWLLRSVLEEQLGSISNAISGYKKFLDLVGRDSGVEKQLIHLLFASKRYYEAADILRKMNLGTPEYYFDLALLEWKANNHERALTEINKSLEKFPDFKKAKIIKVEILISNNQKEGAFSFIQDWLEAQPHDFSVVKLLLLLRQNGIKINSIINSLEKIAHKHNNSEPIYLALADLYLEKNNGQKVIDTCKRILEITKDEGLKSKLFFQIAYVYFEKGNIKQAEKYLKNSMEYKPSYSSAYNLLAYIYAQSNRNLDKALRLVEEALKHNPNCYYYLDTKGYVLLKLGEKEKAIENLQKALSLAGEDKIIEEHLSLAKSLNK